MQLLTSLRARLRRRRVDPERALRSAQAEARRRAVQEEVRRHSGGGLGGSGIGDGFGVGS